MKSLPVIASLAVSLLIGTSNAVWAQSSGANIGCIEDQPGRIECPIRIGTSLLRAEAGRYFVLTNTSPEPIRLDQVGAVVEPLAVLWSEACVYLDELRVGQDVERPGIGEVGCTHRNFGELYTPIRWSSPDERSGLTIAPGSKVFINTTAYRQFQPHDVIVTARAARSSESITVYRFPHWGRGYACDGTLQATEWQTTRNLGSTPKFLKGASILVAQTGTRKAEVQAACVYILTPNRAVRWSFCNNMNRAGWVSFPEQAVAPGEYIAAQAINSCAAGPDAFWNWAAYVSVAPPTPSS